MNNPVMAKDPSGLILDRINFTDEQNKMFDAHLDYLRGLNSPKINAILDEAESDNYHIAISFMDAGDNMTMNDKEKNACLNSILNAYQSGDLFNNTFSMQLAWDYGNSQSDLLGSTILNQAYQCIGVIMLDKNAFEGSYDTEGLNTYAITPIALLDELNHSISKYIKNKNDEPKAKERYDHYNLFKGILEEINQGMYNVSATQKEAINVRLKN
jgi:hypothetical protein